MKPSIVIRIGLACAAIAAPAFLAAPANAGPHPNACLVVENEKSKAIRVTLNNHTHQGSYWDVGAKRTILLTYNRKVIKTSTGNWSVDAPAGSWRYEPNSNTAKGCNGSWILNVD